MWGEGPSLTDLGVIHVGRGFIVAGPLNSLRCSEEEGGVVLNPALEEGRTEECILAL